MKKLLLALVIAVATTAMLAGTSSATLHPVVESVDCAQSANAPTGDIGSPPGQTPGDLNPAGNETGSKDHVALTATGGPSSPAWFGHKLDGVCGKVGQQP